MYKFYILLAVFLSVAVLILFTTFRRQTKKQTLIVVFSFIMATIGCYGYLGDSQGFIQWTEQNNRELLIKNFLAKYHTIDDVVVALKQHLAQHPNDSKGWFLLGRLYKAQGDTVAADEAFAKAGHVLSK